MSHKLSLPSWAKSGQVLPSVVAVVLLFTVSFVTGEVLYWRGLRGAETLVDDLIIGAAGGLVAWTLLSLQARRQETARARELIRLTADVNRQVRDALTMMGNAVLVQNETERLQMMDAAMQRIDTVLSDLVPGKGSTSGHRLFN
jgi:hypothetical protein